MDCHEFLLRYSDYRDGVLADPEAETRMARHVRECPTCMRYDARVSRGVTLLRSLSELEPSQELRGALRRRLATTGVPEAEPVPAAPAAVMVALMVVTAFAVAWWGWSDRTPRPMAEIPVRQQPLPAVVANPGLPFVSFATPGVSATTEEWRSPTAAEPFVAQVALAR